MRDRQLSRKARAGIRPLSPQSDGSVNYFNAATKLSPMGGDNGDSRYHDQSMLINRLKPYYSDKDPPICGAGYLAIRGARLV